MRDYVDFFPRDKSSFYCLEPGCRGHMMPGAKCTPLFRYCGALGCPGHFGFRACPPPPLLPKVELHYCGVLGCPGHIGSRACPLPPLLPKREFRY